MSTSTRSFVVTPDTAYLRDDRLDFVVHARQHVRIMIGEILPRGNETGLGFSLAPMLLMRVCLVFLYSMKKSYFM